MIDLLRDILCAILGLGSVIVDLLMIALNGIIAAIGLAIGGLLSLLPDMPETPATPDQPILNVVLWLLPLGGMIAITTGLWGLFGLAMGARVALKWLKTV